MSDQDASQAQVPKTIDQAAQRASEATGLQVSVRRANADVQSHAPMSYYIHAEAPGGRRWTARTGVNRDECKEALFMLASVAALSPAPGATAQDGDERAAFERWAASHWPNSRPPASAWDGWQGRAAQAPTPTIPAGMVAWGPNSPGYPAPPSDWDNKAVAWGDGTVDRGLIGDKAWERGKNPGGYIIAYTPLAAAPKQAEPQGVERAARAMCVADGLDPDEHIIGGQATGFEDFGPLWQAEERSEGQLGLTNYKRLALAALNAPTGAVEKGEAM